MGLPGWDYPEPRRLLTATLLPYLAMTRPLWLLDEALPAEPNNAVRRAMTLSSLTATHTFKAGV